MQDNRQLTALIGLYLAEKKSLVKFISQSTKEGDYLSAHHYSRRLGQINGELQLLNSILDPNYPEKERTKNSIRFYNKRLRSFHEPKMRGLFASFIAEAEDNLQRLQDTPPMPPSDPQILSRMLEKLMDREITELKLTLDRKNNLSIIIIGVHKFKIKIPKVNTLRKNDVLSDNQIDLLQKWGFEWNNRHTGLVLTVSGNKQEVVGMAMEKLARTVFRLFHIVDMKGQSHIMWR